MDKDAVIERLQLQPHPLEGGFFSRTYESDLRVALDEGSRLLATAIYYLLTEDSPVGFMHKNKSDIVHCYHLGGPIKYTLIEEDGRVAEYILGPDLGNGQLPQLVVKGGVWKIAELMQGEYGLLTEVVAPGFEYVDNEIATHDKIRELFPNLISRFKHLIAE